VRRTVSAKTRLCSGILALVGLAIAAPPAWAAEAPGNANPSGPKSLRAATAAKVATLETKAAVGFNQQAGAGASDSGSFFRTKKGVAALILMAGGVTWAVISRKNDAVHSPAR